jgi:hypothetical protein
MYSDRGRAEAYGREEAQFVARHDYYGALRSGEAGYELLHDLGDVQVYGRRGE